MSDVFGGSSQKSCPPIDTKKFPHGMTNITYKTYDYNPEGPQRPGAHGLEFGCYGGTKLANDVIRLLMRTNKPWWQYMGLYTWLSSTPLSLDEWNAQHESVSSLKSYVMPLKLTILYLVSEALDRKDV